MSQRGARLSLLCAALLTAGLLAITTPSHAAQGLTVQLPSPPKTSVRGLSLLLDCTWADGAGYVPMRLTVNCTAPTAADRTLAVEITTRNRNEHRPATVTTELEIPAGTTTLTKVIPFPRFSTSYQLSFDVYEDGVHLRDLSFENMSMYTTSFGQNMAPATLFVSDSQLDVSKLDFLVQANMYVAPGSAPQPVGTISTIGPYTALAAKDLLEDWIDYSALSVIFISADDVEQLAASRPKAWRALQQWTWAGGNLCVFGVGNDWHGLAALEERLQCPADAEDAMKRDRGWNRPKPELYNVDVTAPGSQAVAVTQPAAPDGTKISLPKAPKKPPFVWKNARMGLVLAMSSGTPFPGKTPEWHWLYNTIDPSRWQWHARHALPAANDESNFDSFLISDVGLPPVKSYRVLITLFVIGIGPVNYWLLRRRGRLHLLLFTVPAAAIVVSTALLAYAIVADGFGSHLRARSYTELDQRNREAVSWARLSYYAGISPRGGLVFPSDTAVLPLDRDLDWRSYKPERTLSWNTQQSLVRGWLASRTPTQYLTVRPYACQRELLVIESGDGAGCAVENRLDTTIRKLMLRSAAGNLFYGSAIAPRGRLELTALDTDEASDEAVKQLYTERNQGSSSLIGNVSTPAARLFFGPAVARRSRSYGNSNNFNSPGLLDLGIAEAFQEVGSRLREPRTYVAVVERPPDVVVGMDGLMESESLHVIFGNW